MSQREILPLIEALLRDDNLGLRPTFERLASALPDAPLGNPGPLSSEFTYYRGQLPGVRPANGGGNIMLRPLRWLPNPQYVASNLVREAVASFEIGFECFSASPADNLDEASLVATALAQVLDGLRAYSDAHDGTVVDIVPPMDFSFGDYEGPTAYGFTARITVNEVSTND